MNRPPTRYKRPDSLALDYGRVIKDSLALVWRHKYLWFFGLFSGSASAFGGWSCDYNSFVTTPGQDESAAAGEIADSLATWLQAHLTLIITLVVIGLVLALAAWLWSILCHGAVVASVRDIHRGETVGFRGAFIHGRQNFRKLLPYMLLWAALPLAILLAFGVLVTVIYILLSAIGQAGTIIGVILLVLLGAALVAATVPTLGMFALLGIWPVAAIFIFTVFNFGSRSVVLDGKRTIAAVKDGARLLFNNLSRAALLFLITVGISIGASIAFVFAAMMAAIPAVVAWIFTYSAGMPVTGVIIAVLLTLVPLVTGLLFTAALNTYMTAFWTDVWMLFKGERRHEAAVAGEQAGN